MFYDHVSLVAPSKIEVCILTQFEKMHLLYSTSLFFWCYWMFEGSFICHANTLPTILWLHALISKCNWIWNFWKRYNSIFVKDLFRSIDFVSMCSPLWLNCFMAYNEFKLLNKELRKNIVGMTVLRFSIVSSLILEIKDLYLSSKVVPQDPLKYVINKKVINSQFFILFYSCMP